MHQHTTENTTGEQDGVNVEHPSTPAPGNRQAERPNLIKFKYRDQIWDKEMRLTRLVKCLPKQSTSKKFSNVIILARRRYTERMLYDHTKYDVIDRRLRELLIDIHKDTKGFQLTDSHIEVDLDELYWALPKLKQRKIELTEKDSHSTETQQEIFAIEAAIELVGDECGSTISDLAETLPRNKIRWGTLWAILTPNVNLYTQDSFGQHRVYRLRRHFEVRKKDESVVLQLETEHVDFDGGKLGVVHKILELPRFSGLLDINDLAIYPLSYHPRADEVEKELLQRGKRQLELARTGHHLKEHKGYGLKRVKNELHKFNTHGRLVIDAAALKEIHPEMNIVPELTGFRVSHGSDTLQSERRQKASRYGKRTTVTWYDTDDDEVEPDSDFEDAELTTYSAEDLPNDLVLLLSGVVYGYSLGDSIWGIFAVTNLEKLNWNEGIFESLVMPEKQRSLMYQLIKSHGTQSSGFDDFVKDKGRGLVGLLLGSPGLGKTLTAEAIAEAAHLPLFTISSGYLGQKAAEINQNLHIFLELATRWKAVLLLDEADVFLSKRSTGDLERNSIVSVFLRELEYYTGILILTTNRAHTIDEAFQSRIHFVHRYPSHDFAARRVIWSNFLANACKNNKIVVNVDEEGLDKLAELPFNGRQIKNAMSIAVELAASNENSHSMGADNIIDAYLCLQNFDFLSPEHERVSITSPSHTETKASKVGFLTLGVEGAQGGGTLANIASTSRVLADSMPAVALTPTPPPIRPDVLISAESAGRPPENVRKKPRKLLRETKT